MRWWVLIPGWSRIHARARVSPEEVISLNNKHTVWCLRWEKSKKEAETDEGVTRSNVRYSAVSPCPPAAPPNPTSHDLFKVLSQPSNSQTWWSMGQRSSERSSMNVKYSSSGTESTETHFLLWFIINRQQHEVGCFAVQIRLLKVKIDFTGYMNC